MFKRIVAITSALCIMLQICAFAAETDEIAKTENAVEKSVSETDNAIYDNSYFEKIHSALTTFGVVWEKPNSGADLLKSADYISVMYSLASSSANTPQNTMKNFLISQKLAPKKISENYNITLEEAIDAFENLICGAVYAKKGTSYYESVKRNLMTDISAAYDQKITNEIFAQLVLNALDIKVVEQTVFGGKAEYAASEKTLLEKRFDIIKGEGKMTANEVTDINAAALEQKGIYVIANTAYFANEDFNEFLGRNVEFYYKKPAGSSSKSTLLYVKPMSDETEIVLNGDDICEADKAYIKYTANGKEYKKTLEDGYLAVYNGRCLAEYGSGFEIGDLANLKNGRVYLYDTDSDGKIDLLRVYKYFTMVVTSKSASDFSVCDAKYSKVVYKISDTAYTHYTVKNASGKKLSYDDIYIKDAISIAESLDGKIAEFIVERNMKSGTADSKYTENGKKIICVSGVDYTLCENCEWMYDDIEIGGSVTVYLDSLGNAAGIDTADKKGVAYGILMETEREESAQKNVILRIFALNGKIIAYRFADNVEIDGKKYKNQDEAQKALYKDGEFKSELIGYKTNLEQEIIYVETADKNISFDDRTLKIIGERDTYSFYANSKVFERKTATGEWRPKFPLSDLTKVFVIPNTELADEDLYEVQNVKYMADFTNYDAEIYTKDVTLGMCDFVVLHQPKEDLRKISKSTENFFLVNKKIKAVDEEGNYVVQLKGYDAETATAMTIICNDSVNNIDEISDGSVVLYAGDSDGRICDAEVVYKIDGNNNGIFCNDKNPYEIISYTQRRVTYGSVYLRGEGFLRLALYDPSTKTFADLSSANFENTDAFPLYSRAKIYKLSSERDGNKFSEATLNDICDYRRYNTECSNVIGIMRGGLARIVIICDK